MTFEELVKLMVDANIRVLRVKHPNGKVSATALDDAIVRQLAETSLF